jgi:hypothetical protein
MELLAAILLAGPLGFFVKRGLLAYLIVWALIFPVQSAVVLADGNDPAYWVVNAVILALGIALNRLGLRVRRRKVQGALVMRNERAATTIET